jgi:hypothetical protein
MVEQQIFFGKNILSTNNYNPWPTYTILLKNVHKQIKFKQKGNKIFKLQGLVNNSWCKVVAPLNLVQTTKYHLLYLHSYLYVILLFIYMIHDKNGRTYSLCHKLEIIDWNVILTWRLGTSWTKVLENNKGTNFICNFLGSRGGWWGYNISSIKQAMWVEG